MKQVGYTYTIATRVEITYQELLFLIELSEHHYDDVCRAASKVGGFLYGIRNQFELSFTLPDPLDNLDVEFTNRQLGILNKIMEQVHLVQNNPCKDLWFELKQIFKNSIAHQKEVYQGLSNTSQL